MKRKKNASSRVLEWIVPKPELPRQIGRELVVFWRAAATPGRREGLALKVHTCTAKDCRCRAVKLDGFVVTDDTATIEALADEMRIHRWSVAPDAHERNIFIELDVDTGELKPLDTSVDRDLLAWVGSEVDGELLESLHERWMIAKGYPGRGPIRPNLALPNWNVGELLGFHDVYARGRIDCYVVDEQQYVASVRVCPIPSCDCHRAAVIFHTRQDDAPREVGRIELVLVPKTIDVTAIRQDRGCDRLVDTLWDRFARRHHVRSYLAEREARMHMAWGRIERALGHLDEPTVSAAPSM